jgi:hypothetical protein
MSESMELKAKEMNDDSQPWVPNHYSANGYRGKKDYTLKKCKRLKLYFI